MAILDDVIGVFSPGWKAARLRSRAVIQAYEAVKTTRTHKARRENRTADQLSQYGAVSLREQARYLDNNHDLVIGVFDKLEERVVGKNGIIVEPHPVLRNGAIARDLAAEIRTRWSEWSVSPEVTGQFTRPMLERLMLRTWLRDGEVFAQMVSGRINSLTPSAGVHFWLEALEPDFIPMTSDESNRLNQGVFVDDWGRPEKYLVYKSRPVSGRQMETKEVDAERMLHLKFVRRLHQMRGTSLLSGVLIRLSALKEYEDSELTAARIAAALGMYIRKGDGQSYEPDGNGSKENERELTIQPGIIYDDLKPGEEIGMVKSDRPNPNLETFRNGQLRAVAAGSRLSFSSTARNYNGTYSAQRQELVESTDGYLILQDWFIGAVTRPMYRAWLKQAVASGVIRLPRDLDRSSLYTAVYSGPVMPWIDPVKEAEAWKIQIRGGAATESDWVRAGGRNPDDVKRRRKAEIDENRKLDLVFGINDLFAMFGGRYQTLQAQCLADPECSLEQAREKLLNEMGRESTPSNKNTPAHIYAGNGNFVGDGIRQALMARAGFEKTERDNVYNGMTLREYARMSLTERGIGVSSYNPMQMVGAAFTHSTSDFGNILLDVANKAILQGWEDAPETYEQWTRKGQLSDFKIAHRVGMGGFSALRQVREGAEYKYVTTGDKQATIALATYGELFSITRQAIINDDLNMLTDVPMKLGRAAKSTIADLVYAILTSNPKISTDNVSLFDKAKHANVLESAAMDVASLDKARQLMRVQKEGERHLNIRPAFVLVPTAMESVANQVIRSSSVKGADINAGIINPVKDFATVIAEPRLDDNSQTTFYLAASKGSDTIEVAYLNGVDTPYIDQMEGFSVDGVTTKVRIDAGVAPVDHRGLVKCTA
ncbi:ClpP-like prohead protease/major capsid protein fusion protein [Escherichia coli]|uniref:ClpP-like prohead protease/major capsid protein fusion protein n=80 Tax=Enterobacteriaceae TaxID=543 RepID=UPI001BFDC887|nr:ClpP-like prohead protease/major capsid protein fusion protein [Escherichia coli]